MEECKYCTEIDNIEVSRDIFYERVTAKFNDKVEIGLADITVWITDEAKMELYVDECEGYNRQILKKTIDINYCPFCGRRLRND